MKFAHIVNPVNIGPESDLFVAQRFVFPSIVHARRCAAPDIQVELFAAGYPEDRGMTPDAFIWTPFLERSVADLGVFDRPRRLPLLGDILHRLYDASDAEYFIYTNADIIVQPHFYTTIARLIERGERSIAFSRRNVPDTFTDPDDLPLLLAHPGEAHPTGYDTFVFRRDAVPGFRLEAMCIGMAIIDWAMMVNMIAGESRTSLYSDWDITLHIGNDLVWRREPHAPYWLHNYLEYVKVWALKGATVERSGHPMTGTLKDALNRKLQTMSWYEKKHDPRPAQAAAPLSSRGGLLRTAYRHHVPPFIRHRRLPRVLRDMLRRGGE